MKTDARLLMHLAGVILRDEEKEEGPTRSSNFT